MANRVTLNVSLTPRLLCSVREHVAVGRYGSASEVIRVALGALELTSPSGQPPSKKPRAKCDTRLEAENSRLRAEIVRLRRATGQGTGTPSVEDRDATGPHDARLEHALVALASSETRLRAVLESAADYAIITTDPDGRITSWNAGARNIMGWEESEVLGRHAHLFFTPEDCVAGVPETKIATSMAAGRTVDERWHLRRDGSRFWADGRMTPLRDGDGAEFGFLKILCDRTAARGAEETNARLAAIVTATSDAVIGIAAQDRRVFAWNGGAEALFGYTEAEALGAAVDLLVPPELPDYDPTEAFHRVLAGERVHDHETVRMAKDGTRIPVTVTVARMLASDGRPIGVSVIFRDLRVRRRVEAALRESQRRLKATHDNAGVGICEVDGAGRYIGVNETFARMTGFTTAELGTRNFLDDIEGEADRHGASMALAAMVRGEVEAFDDRGECTDRQGRRWWAEAKTTAIRDEGDGRFLYAVRVVQDVSERQAAEKRQALLSREVDHRAKNALAVVQAALRLTRAADMPSYVRAVEGRVAALARAQTLLAEDRWAGADLRALLAGELAPFLGNGGAREPRAVLAGPAVELPPGAAQPLAMAVHELATNATKHGALSSPGGRVLVSWGLVPGETRALRLRWVEAGGPAVAGTPSRRGFGSRVLEGTLRNQLRGAVSLTWEPSGLVCDIEVPLGRVVEAPALTRAT